MSTRDPEPAPIFLMVMAILSLVALLFSAGVDEKINAYIESQERHATR